MTSICSPLTAVARPSCRQVLLATATVLPLECYPFPLSVAPGLREFQSNRLVTTKSANGHMLAWNPGHNYNLRVLDEAYQKSNKFLSNSTMEKSRFASWGPCLPHGQSRSPSLYPYKGLILPLVSQYAERMEPAAVIEAPEHTPQLLEALETLLLPGQLTQGRNEK